MADILPKPYRVLKTYEIHSSSVLVICTVTYRLCAIKIEVFTNLRMHSI